MHAHSSFILVISASLHSVICGQYLEISDLDCYLTLRGICHHAIFLYH